MRQPFVENTYKQSRELENTGRPFPFQYCIRDSNEPSEQWSFVPEGHLCVSRAHMCRHTRLLHPLRVGSLWVECGSRSLDDPQPKTVPTSPGELTNPAKPSVRGARARLCHRAPMGKEVVLNQWSQPFPCCPTKNRTLGEPEAKMKEAAVASCLGVLAKGVFVLSRMTWFLICRLSSFERYFCSLISTRK